MDAYRKRVLRGGATHKERVINEMKESFLTHLEESPATHNILVSNKPYTVLMADRRFADEELNGKYIIAKWSDKFNIGDYVQALEETWMIDLLEEETVETKRAYRILPCNNILKWQDVKGQIYEFPCHAVDKTSVYSDGLSKGTNITTSTYQLQAIVPYNDYVKMINTNDRFIFNHNVHNIYYVTRIDSITRKGLVYITMKRDEYTVHIDDLENNLSKPIGTNALLEDNIVTPKNPIDEIEYYDLEIVGLERLNVRLRNVEYLIHTNENVEWELIGSLATINIEDNKVYLNPTGGYGSVTLKATIGEVVLEKKINIGFM